jgi:membrane-bound lytic murein transglycosylase D
LLLAVCGAPVAAPGPAAVDAPPATDEFPQYEAIQDHVGFWVRVFSEWTLGQAVVHDADRPALIYEVVDLPGPVGDSYTPQQKAFLASVVEGWSDYLGYLEAKVEAQRALSDMEKRWVLHVTGVAGTNGLDGAAGRLRTQRGMRERFREGLARAGRYDDAIRQILADHGLPRDLAYLPHVESSFQWHARSKVGAAGLWQFTRATGRRFMTIDGHIDERLDPIASTHAAARYLREAFDVLRSWPLALTAYNHGVGGMQRAQQLHGDYETVFRDYRGRSFGFASKNFYSEFLAAREVAAHAESYFPEGLEREPAFDLDPIVVDRSTTPAGVARAWGVELDALASVNPAWHRRLEGTVLPAGSRAWLPSGTLAARAARGPTSPEVPGVAEASTASAPWHVVRPGETLGRIASRYDLTVTALRELNDLPRTSNLIRPGQRLRVAASLPAASAGHVVSRGDTLSSIARRYRVQLIDLLRVNTLELDSVIRPGQTLLIP